VAAVGLIYIHPLSAWMLVAHALVTLRYAGAQWRWRLIALYIPVLLGAIPIARFLIINRARADWIPEATPWLVGRELSQLMGGVLLAVALAVVIALGLARRWRDEMPALRLPLLLIALTIGGILLMSVFIQPLFIGRYLIGVLPLLFIVVARAATTLPWPRAIVAGLLALSLAGSVSWLIDGVKDDWRSAAAYVDAHQQPGDGVIIWPGHNRLPFGYYASPGEPLYPSTPWTTLYLPLWGPRMDLPADADNSRIWLVRGQFFAPPPDIAALLAGYEVVSTEHFGTSLPVVDLLQRRSP
jgi:hypothetical protein